MNRRISYHPFLLAVALAAGLLATTARAQPVVSARIDARMMRQPAVSATQIAFVYAGDIWLVERAGGVAVRLSSPKGEESFPRFSPDGSLLAFTGAYDGNEDIYVVPVAGGLPQRVTHHGAPDRILGWYPEGNWLLYATSMTSPKNRFNQLYQVRAEGGLPEKLPVPYGEFGAISPDGKTLAYVPISVDFRTWKRYRGGMNPDIWLFDLEDLTARNLTESAAADSTPMWHGETLYFLSDRDEHQRANLWACDLKRNKFRQVTFFKEFDVHFPSIGPGDIVFENAGRLHLLDLETEKYREVEIRVVTDRATLKPHSENVSNHLFSTTISPGGKRALFEARGDVFSAPTEHGVVLNLTRSSGVAERHPAWSPDGKWIAYFSDRTGEYELTVRRAATSPGTNELGEQTLTELGPGYRYRPQWSPDSKRIAFIDQAMRINLFDFEAKTNAVIGRQLWLYHDELSRFRVGWSADSRWIAWAQDLENGHSAIALYDCRSNVMHQVTSGFYNDESPVFDPDGKYLFFRTGRTFVPSYSELDPTWIYANTAVLAAVPLRKEVISPLAPRNDMEGDKAKDKKDEEEKKKEDDKGDKPKDTEQTDKKKEEKKKEEKPKAVEIDLAGFEERVVVLPPKAGRYDSLAALPGKLLFRRLPRVSSGEEKHPVVFYDLEKREEKTVLADADFIELSANREKLLARKDNDYAIIEPKEGQKLEKKINTSGFMAPVDPVAEWRQIFTDAWRLQRDYFYDPGLHGVDWAGMRERYGRLLEDAVTRWDVNYVLGELIAELNASHTYRSGGDVEKGPTVGVGYLGCDFALENGAYRIKRIVRAAEWDSEARSPLLQPGVTNVQEGDYLLAVNGEPLDAKADPWAAFQGLADKPVLLTVNDTPEPAGAREALVQTLASEERLRNLAWIEENRKRVEELSGGKVGYAYVPDTGQNGQNELVRMLRAQVKKPGLVIDERFNSGGQIPDRFIELLNRPLRNYWAVRHGRDWMTPAVTHLGPKAMLINGWSGSGGDCLPFYFKQSKLGPLIGMRTWGGLIGITGSPKLVDGGGVTVPAFAVYSTNAQWIIEGHGVEPDIEVVDDPAAMAKGTDPQLERAVAEVMKQLRKHPPAEVKRPPYPKRPGV
ncbi:MAG TPA: PDZ domain-containing protein [Candidatus Paceibacterota bacterium]|nr:PDZ domain-containing protein [Verrucomicrobiota bacterium]HSA09977.1 PDZ domain-containing protein [Candidatus Paceibacterota bacterium]